MAGLQRFLTVAALTVCFFVVALPTWAMPPPEPGEIEKYRQDGTLEARIENAKKLGNHIMDENLVYQADLKLRRMLNLPVPLRKPPPADKGMPTTGTVKILVMCVAFADYPESNSIATIDDKLFGDGDPEDFPYESLKNYYLRSSYNQLTIEGNVLGWYTTDYNREEVVSERALIKELFLYFDLQGHDFSQYDNDGDGIIDYFMIIWTGPHTGWASDWWAHKTIFGYNDFYVDGKTLRTYSWNWESYYSTYYGSPGEYEHTVTIHETGHGLGLPDYYDYDGGVGPPNGVGNLDMMDANWGDHNAFSKFVLDWITPSVYASGTTTGIPLEASDNSKDAAIVMPEAVLDDQFGEYFIVQNRNMTGNDYDHPGAGLLIWHVDARLDANEYDYEYDNSWTEHKLLRLMEADGLEEIESGYSADAGDYYVSGHELSPASMPNNNRYNGTSSGMTIYDISAAGATMTFSVSFDTTPPSDITFVNDGTGTDIDAATSGTQLSANWSESSDAESGVAKYWYAIGTTSGASDTVAWTDIGQAMAVTRTELALTDGQMYYFAVMAENGAALQSNKTMSDGQTVSFMDISPPVDIDYVRDGTAYDVDFISSLTELSANWPESWDAESGVAKYWYAIGTTSGASDTVAWTDNGTDVEINRTDLALADGQPYYVTVKAENGAGLFSNPVTSDGQTVDTTPPADIATVNDGTGADIDVTTWLTRLSANWSDSSDDKCDVAKYWYAIGKSTGSADVVGWTDVDLSTSVTKTELALIDNQYYYFTVKAENEAGLQSNPVNSDGQMFDLDETPPPAIATVNDGFGIDIDVVDSNTELSANWSETSDPESDILKYLYAIGTATGATDVVYWTDVGLATSVTSGNLDKLTDRQIYYFAVKAENGASLESAPAYSDGQMVDVFDINSVTQMDSTSIDVTYSREVDSSANVINTANYLINQGVGNPASAILQADNKTVRFNHIYGTGRVRRLPTHSDKHSRQQRQASDCLGITREDRASGHFYL